MAKGTRSLVFIMTCVHSWDDPRIFHKEAVSLAQKYRVELHAPADFTILERKNVKIVGLPKYQKRYLRPVNWVRLGYRAVKSRAQVIHFHDPELIFVALFLCFFGRKKIIYDVHEDIPASILTKPWIPQKLRVVTADLTRAIERRCAGFFDSIILAEYSYRKNFFDCGIPLETILNFPLARYLPKEVCLNREDETVRLIYAGGVSESRGVREIIHSLFLLKNAGVRFHFDLVGTWVSAGLHEEIKKMIHDYDLEEQVTITGKISLEEVFLLYGKSDIGLALLHPEKNYIHSLATKIFEYMAAGVPVIASNFSLWQELIDKNKCGITADPLNVREIFYKILFLVYNPMLRSAMGRNGRHAFLNFYNWEREERKLWYLYDRLLDNSLTRTSSKKEWSGEENLT